MGSFRDLRYAIRGFIATPALAVALLVSIALGAGSNAIVLGFIRGSVSPPPPIAQSDALRLVLSRDSIGTLAPLAFDDFRSLAGRTRQFASMGAVRESQSAVEYEGHTILAASGLMSRELISVLEWPRRDGVFVAESFWRSALGGTLDVATSSLRVDGRTLPVAGLVPSGLAGLFAGRAIDIWIPMDEAALPASDRTSRAFWVIGRLAPGGTTATAELEMAGASPFIVAPYTGVEPNVAGSIARLRTLLPAASLVVFLVACANIASLVLSRASRRTHETSVRVALGARHRRLVGQLLADSIVIAVAGVAVASPVAFWTASILPALFFEGDAASLSFAPNAATLAAGGLVCIALTALCGLAPIGEIRNVDPAAVLRREGRGMSDTRRRLRAGLLVTQKAFCCVLLLSAAVLLRGLQGALRTAGGDRAASTVVAAIDAPTGSFDDVEAVVRKTAGVTSVAWTSALPGRRPSWRQFRIEPLVTSIATAQVRVAVFPPAGTRVLPTTVGRAFGARDNPGSCPVAMVNDVAANTLFAGDPVGRVVIDPAGVQREIVGVVHLQLAPGARPEREPTIYYYVEQGAPPIDPATLGTFRIPATAAVKSAELDSKVVSSDYFEMTSATVITGQVYPPNVSDGACGVALVNAEAEQDFFGGHATGRAVLDEAGHRFEIAGVVHVDPMRATVRRTEPSIFYPPSQHVQKRLTLMFSTSGNQSEIVERVRAGLAALLPGARALEMRTLDAELMRTSLASERIATTLVTICAGSTLLLCVIGVYGLMADSVRWRRREIATRVAFGAPPWTIARAVFGEGLRLAGAGAIAVGLASIAIHKWLSQFAPSASPTALWMWAAAPLVLAATVLAGGLVPAVRAVTVSPLVAMREE